MATRGGPVHVVTTRRHHKGKVYEAHLLRRTYREDGKVKNQTVGNLSHLPPHIIAMVRGALRGETLLPPQEVFAIERALPHGHVAAVLGTLRKLGLEKLLGSRRSRERDLCVALIAERLLEPGSKLATARGLDPAAMTSSLAEVLQIAGADADDLDAAMDWLRARQGRIEAALAKRHLADGSLVLYDVTSTYFEGRTCPLAKLGYSRDGKRGTPRIVFGVLCNGEGCPLAVQVFDGATGDPATLTTQLQTVRRRFGISRLTWVGDRGMITEARLREDLKTTAGLDWITALRAPAIRALARDGALQLSLFDERDLAEITHPAYPGERLIVCRNPLLAAERARTREELLQASERDLAKIAAATKRQRRPLRGTEQIALRVGKVLGRYKMAKHFRLTITDDGFAYERDTARIAEEAALDGLYVIRTSVEAERLSAADTVRAYKRLATVERAFRTLMGLDLRVRPIYHRLEERVRAHVFLCLLAYHVEWHLRRALAPLLFDDEEAGGAPASSPVAPAQRSAAARRKAQRQQTADGLPAHSFRGLLRQLATLTTNRVHLKAKDAAFDQLTLPTPLQQRAFDLLGVSPNL